MTWFKIKEEKCWVPPLHCIFPSFADSLNFYRACWLQYEEKAAQIKQIQRQRQRHKLNHLTFMEMTNGI